MRDSLSLTPDMEMMCPPEMVGETLDWSGHFTLFRFWLVLSRVYGYMKQGKFEIAQAQVVQSFKAIEKARQDGGKWLAAWAFTGLADPTQRNVIGASQRELEIIAKQLKAEATTEKALGELLKKSPKKPSTETKGEDA